MLRVVLATGGTGGHIFPALAVAEALRASHPDVRVVLLGGLYGPEKELAAKAGLEFVGLPVRGVIGRGLRGVGAGFAMVRGLAKAMGFLRRFQPTCVLGFGGYAAFAGVLGAVLLGVPAAIHEQNALPGKSNRVLGRLVRRIYLSLPVAEGFSPEKTRLVGNPVRLAIRQGIAAQTYARAEAAPQGDAVVQEDANPRRHLLVMGGSQGAKAINDAVIALLPQLVQFGVHLWHQTGPVDVARVRAAYAMAGVINARVDAFVDNMAEAYAWASLAFCRAGGSSLAELTAAGVPAILVPFPFATHNHQWFNAKALVDAGGAVLLEQNRITAGPDGNALVLAAITEILNAPGVCTRMANASRAAAKPEAAETLAEAIANQFA
ncbi:undecaprenyldiphospho-muramoylpentapeptide beta-N-acetylglucosaminyltransferase [Desulfovibrio cuneatus]|uniref:undecaprenyldiphospho-muramoylpentapeptide beta-N-acetylglucosaminyltransferase n=1 Tax=Desulfovibrio cuneatus TaxID=159728 RepID=UPI000411EDC6|nr:undecaprenyldiphospho-muramoylpentapeptide beta-N-acetylglucosaminyltransferase [Desulfovibrio cuneatus]